MDREVKASHTFLQIFFHLNDKPPHKYPNEKSDKRKFAEFIANYLSYGFDNKEATPGRLKHSNNVDKDDPYFLKKVRYANEHKLWHYHVGIDIYNNEDEASPGDFCSEWVIDFQYFREDLIKLVDFNAHPPFKLPNEQALEGDNSFPFKPQAKRPNLKVIK